MIKFALIGFGGIARCHKAAHTSLENEGFGSKLVAICDIRPEIFGQDMEKELRELNFKRANPNHVHIFAQKIEKIIPYDEQIKRGFINIISALIIFILLFLK